MSKWKRPKGKTLAFAFMVAVLVHLSLSPPALAAGAQERVKETLDAVSAVLNDPQLQGPDKEEERKQRVRRIIYDTFDFEEMARESLGGHWADLTPRQREEFVNLFGELFERSYNRLVLRFLPERKTLYGTESIEEDRALVQTTLIKEDEQLPVDYRLTFKGGRWAVFDVVIDGVSLAMNYRTQFNKIIRTSSYETLVRKMKIKQEQESF